jgi:hypothetical protein
LVAICLLEDADHAGGDQSADLVKAQVEAYLAMTQLGLNGMSKLLRSASYMREVNVVY